MNNKPNFNVGGGGKTPFQRFQALAKALVKVPRKELDAKIKQAAKKPRSGTNHHAK